MQGHFDPKKSPPVSKWKTEQAKLIAECGKLNQQYNFLRDEVKDAE
jgi:hypothetical protein